MVVAAAPATALPHSTLSHPPTCSFILVYTCSAVHLCLALIYIHLALPTLVHIPHSLICACLCLLGCAPSFGPCSCSFGLAHTCTHPPLTHSCLFMPTWLCAFVWPLLMLIWLCPHLYSSSHSLAHAFHLLSCAPSFGLCWIPLPC